MFIQNICTNLFSLVQRDLAFLLENLAHFFAEKVFSNTTAGKLSEKNCALVVQPILEEERKRAADTIQNAARKYLAAKKAEEQQAAALIIRKAVQGYVFNQKKQKNDAAIIIQRSFRSHLQRQKNHKAATVIQKSCCKYKHFGNDYFLSSKLSRPARNLIDQGGVSQFPRSENGKTPVYFPPNLPVVLKELTSPSNLERVKKTMQAKAFCETSGYHCLNIPSACIYRNWIIENRLPITSGLDQKEQIGLYIENKEAFTKAVREFTAFLCQAELEDLSGMVKNNPWSSLCEVGLPRYDNAALFLDEEGKGKIALVDLETFKLLPPGPTQHQLTKACAQAMRLFPLHWPEILEEAKKFHPLFTLESRELDQERGLLCRYFDVIYQNHRSFLSRQSVALSKSSDKISSSPEEIDLLAKRGILRLEPFLGNLLRIRSMQDVSFCLFLTSLPAERKAIFMPPDWGECEDVSPAMRIQLEQEILPKIYSILLQEMEGILSQRLASLQEPLSFSKFLAARSLLIEKNSPSYCQLQEKLVGALEPMKLENEWQKKYLSEAVTDEMLKILVEEDKIAYFNPEFGFRSNPCLCIFV